VKVHGQHDQTVYDDRGRDQQQFPAAHPVDETARGGRADQLKHAGDDRRGDRLDGRTGHLEERRRELHDRPGPGHPLRGGQRQRQADRLGERPPAKYYTPLHTSSSDRGRR